MPNRNRNLVGMKFKKSMTQKWMEKIKSKMRKIMEWYNKLYRGFMWVSLLGFIILTAIFAIAFPNDIRKWLLLFYMFCVGFLTVLLLLSEYKKNGFIIAFKDTSWLSYITFVIVEMPVILMLIYTCIVKICRSVYDAGTLLQAVYWCITVSHVIWIIYHIKIKSSDQVKINLMLKLMVVIISGVGLVMDIVGRINFVKQFLVIAWTVLLVSYISDKRQSNLLETKEQK